MAKDPFQDEAPLQPVSSLDSMYYGQQPEQPLAPVPQQEGESLFGEPTKKSQGIFRDFWNNISRMVHNRTRQYTPEELARFRREVMPPDFESKATIGQQLENLGDVSAAGLQSLSYPLYQATNQLPAPVRFAARTMYGDLPLWAASLPSAITSSAGRMIYPVELAMKSDEDEGVVHAREKLLEKNEGLPWKPDDPANFVGLGTVPGKNFALGTFAGKEFAERLWSAGIKKPLETLHLAQQLEKEGKSPAEIWMETAKQNMAENNNYIGWEKRHGDWTLEVHDQASFNKDGPEIGKLTDSYRNPPVEKGIDLNDITLVRNPKEFGGEYNADFINPEIGVGTRAYTTKTQNPNIFGKEWSPRSVASHEVQHFIQDIEKWQNGTNPDAVLKGHYGPNVEAALKQRTTEIANQEIAKHPELKEASQDTILEILAAARKDAAFELYEKVAGEVQARNVQKRLDMTPEERLAKRPELTEDVPRDQQILDAPLKKASSKAEPPQLNPKHLREEEWSAFVQRVPKEPRPINDGLSLVAERSGNYVNYYLLPKGKTSPWAKNGNNIAVGRFVVRRGQNGGVEVTNANVWKEFQKKGNASKVYDIIENDFKGTDLMPSPWNQLSEPAFNFWNKRAPEKLQWQRDNMDKYARFERDMYPERKVGTRLPDSEPMLSKHREKTAMEELREKYKAEETQHYSPEETAVLTDMWDFVQTMKKVKQPERLSTWLTKEGGLKEYEGELNQLTDRNRRPGLMSKNGRDLDAAAQKAWEEGFLESAERPTINDLLNALDEDLRGNHVYRARDAETVADLNQAQRAIEELRDHGIETKADIDRLKRAHEAPRVEGPREEGIRRTEGQERTPREGERVPEQVDIEDIIRRNTPPAELPPTFPPNRPPADTARIVPSQPKKDTPTFDKFYTMAKDDLHPIRRMEEALLEGRRGTLAEPDKSPYTSGRVSKKSLRRSR